MHAGKVGTIYLRECGQKDFHTAPYINYMHASLSLTLFQKRVEFESQNACIINTWGCAEMFPCEPVLYIEKNYLYLCIMKQQRDKPMLHPIRGSICIIMSALSQSVSFTSFRFCSHLDQSLKWLGGPLSTSQTNAPTSTPTSIFPKF